MKLGVLAKSVFVLAAVFALFAFGLTARDGELRRACSGLCALGPTYAGETRVAPDFELPSLDGGRLRLADYRGKVVILNFWTKTCQPCLQEMPALERLATLLRFAYPNVVLLSVTTDESVEDARETLRRVLGGAPSFPVGVDPGGAVVGDQYGTRLFPETWFIDPEGILRARIDGARSEWADPVVTSFAESLAGPLHCPITFEQGRPEGDEAGICSSISSVR